MVRVRDLKSITESRKRDQKAPDCYKYLWKVNQNWCKADITQLHALQIYFVALRPEMKGSQRDKYYLKLPKPQERKGGRVNYVTYVNDLKIISQHTHNPCFPSLIYPDNLEEKLHTAEISIQPSPLLSPVYTASDLGLVPAQVPASRALRCVR